MMNNYNKTEITLKRVKEIMNEKEFNVNKVNTCLMTQSEKKERIDIEKYNSFPVVTLFDDLMSEYNDIPSQDYYIDWYLYKCYEWIEQDKACYKDSNGKWQKLQWTETAVKVLTNRASRAYYSRMMELYIIATIKEFMPFISIYSNPILDVYGAVDIMLLNNTDNKIIYAHVLRESNDATNQLNTKSANRRKFYYKDPKTNQRYDFLIDRDFTTHTAIKYGTEESKDINGYKVPTTLSIIKQVMSEFKRDDLQTLDNPEYLLDLVKAVSHAFPEIHFIDISSNNDFLIS